MPLLIKISPLLAANADKGRRVIMQRGGQGSSSLRASWRQRQATRAACEALLLRPTLTARPLLLQARLAPLFATYCSKLACENVIWDQDEDGEVVADQSGSKSSGKRIGGGNGSSSGGSGCREQGSGAEFRAGDAESETDGVRLAILQHIRSLEAADGWRGLNRVLLHGLLVGAWREARAAGMLAVPTDEFAPDASWQLSTGAR